MSDRIARLEAMQKIAGEGSMNALEKRISLNLYRRNLTSVPPGVWDLTALAELCLHDNQLLSLPPEISQLTGLTYLSVNNNLIEELPPQITALTNLKRLYVQDGSGKINIMRAPRGITNLPCWNNTSDTWGGLSIADALRKLQLYDPVDTAAEEVEQDVLCEKELQHVQAPMTVHPE